MASLPQPRCPRRVSAVLIGRARVTLVGRQQQEPEVLLAAGPEFAPGELEALLRRAVADKRLRGRVALGFEPASEFFSTERRDEVAEGRSGSMLDTLVSEFGSDKIGREITTVLPADLFSTALIVPAGPAREARKGLARLGVANVRLISTTHALHALSAAVHPRRKGGGAEIRVLAGGGAGIALLCQDGDPLARHVFEYSQAYDHAILSAARRLLVVARDNFRLEGEPELILHVDAEAPLLAQARADLAVAVAAAPALDYGAALTGAGVALAAFRRGGHINLLQASARAVGTEPAEFPLAGVAGVGAAMLATVFWLNNEASALDTRAENVDAGNAPIIERFGTDIFELRDQEQRHAFAAHLFAAFGKDRARWTPLLLELPRVLPAGARLQRFEGNYGFWFAGDDPSAPPPSEELEMNRWCELTVWAPLAEGGGAPLHGSLLGAALQASPAFQSIFRVVTGPQVNIITQSEDPHADVRIRLLTR